MYESMLCLCLTFLLPILPILVLPSYFRERKRPSPLYSSLAITHLGFLPLHRTVNVQNVRERQRECMRLSQKTQLPVCLPLLPSHLVTSFKCMVSASLLVIVWHFVASYSSSSSHVVTECALHAKPLHSLPSYVCRLLHANEIIFLIFGHQTCTCNHTTHSLLSLLSVMSM